ncbi:unnamed protein product [Ostreobium quekettii]|uniref:RBR-type E3 ubiquitin transferase n=1 Tax=Ostreobium quekettii TaxID=121088 RepID=A0A8S1JA07_9CHLO|nr:unnamed protein product [Ostreobium quekettii]
MSLSGDGDASENWQQQVEEIVALSAIYGEDFRLVGSKGLPEFLEQGDLDISSLPDIELSCYDVTLEGEAYIYLEAPEGDVTVRVDDGSADSSNAATEGLRAGQVEHLPPLSLGLTFHPAYPCSQPPNFRLSCIWLSNMQLSKLCGQLDELWVKDGAGMPICFTWIDWIKTSALEFLGIGATLLLKKPPSDISEGVDSRAKGHDKATLDATVFQMHRFDQQRRIEVFRQGTWSCPICMDVVSGQQCVRLPACQHFACFACMSAYCKVNVADGNVNLKCPQHKCTVTLEPHILKKCLSQEDYERWEALTLQRTLDGMKDVCYCPRCHSVCLEEPGNFAQCAKCLFVFCTNCFDSYHPASQCVTPEEKIAKLQKAAEDGASRKEQQRLLIDLRQQEKSTAFIESNMVMCPGCCMYVQHSGGCNKMACTYCHCYFCYKCGQLIDGYDHFWGERTCDLFDMEAIAEWEREMAGQIDGGREDAADLRREAMGREAEARGFVARRKWCPQCRHDNYKIDRNNHIKCWACGHGFCYLCGMLLARGGVAAHFNKTGCKQHSDD